MEELGIRLVNVLGPRPKGASERGSRGDIDADEGHPSNLTLPKYSKDVFGWIYTEGWNVAATIFMVFG